MDEDRQLVERIRTFMRSEVEGDVEELSELAGQYARACREVNERLSRCRAHLDAGLRSEAVKLAEERPPVLERVALLVFYGHDQWRMLCEDNREHLEVPPRLDRKTVERLNAAYFPDEDLENLLDEYRSIVHTGDVKEKIRLLRRIVNLDPEDADQWREDLRELEAARLQQLPPAVDEAREHGDLERLESLKRELEAQQWLQPVPDDLVNTVERAILRLKKRNARRKAEKIAEEAWNAYGALDYPRANKALRKWAVLCRKDYFDPPSKLQSNIEEIQEWCEQEYEKREKKRKFDSLTDDLRKVLEEDGPADEVERLLFQAEQFDRELPHYLIAKARKKLRDAELQHKRRRRILVGAAVCCLIIVGALIYRGVRASIRDKEYAESLETIETAYEGEDYETVEDEIDELKEQLPEMARRSEVQDWEYKLEDAQDRLAEEAEEFSEIMEKLEAAAQNDWPEDVNYDELQSRADSLIHEQAQRQRFEKWHTVRKQHLDKIRKERLKKFKGKLTELRKISEKLDDRDPQKDTENFAELVREADGLMERAEELVEKTGTGRDQLELMGKRVARAKDSLESARERKERKRELLDEMASVRRNLDTYEELAATYLDEFPDDSESERAERIQTDIRLGRDLMRVNEWEFDNGTDFPAERAEFLESREGRDTLWRKTLEWWRHIADTDAAREEFRQNVEDLHDMPLFESLLSARDHKGQVYYFYDKPEYSGGTADRHRYRGKCLKSPSRSGETTFRTDKRLTLDDVDDLLAEHCRWVRNLYGEIDGAEAENYTGILLRALDELAKNEQIDAVVKGGMFQDTLPLVRDMSFEDNEWLQKLEDKMEDIETDVPWMDYRGSTRVEQAREKIKKTLEDVDVEVLSRLAARAEARSEIFGTVLDRDIRFAGQVDKTNNGYEVRASKYAEDELWIVVTEEDDKAVYVAARKENGRYKFTEDVRDDDLYEGRPLFSRNQMTHGSREEARRIVKGIDGAENIPPQDIWPAVWPRNARVDPGKTAREE